MCFNFSGRQTVRSVRLTLIHVVYTLVETSRNVIGQISTTVNSHEWAFETLSFKGQLY